MYVNNDHIDTIKDHWYYIIIIHTIIKKKTIYNNINKK